MKKILCLIIVTAMLFVVSVSAAAVESKALCPGHEFVACGNAYLSDWMYWDDDYHVKRYMVPSICTKCAATAELASGAIVDYGFHDFSTGVCPQCKFPSNLK